MATKGQETKRPSLLDQFRVESRPQESSILRRIPPDLRSQILEIFDLRIAGEEVPSFAWIKRKLESAGTKVSEGYILEHFHKYEALKSLTTKE